jgi:hypothetical protein
LTPPLDSGFLAGSALERWAVRLSGRNLALAIVLDCDCGRKLQIPETYAGREGRCPSCGRTLQIPRSDDNIVEAPLAYSAVAVEPTPAEAAPLPSQRVEAVEPVASEEPVKNHGGDVLPVDADFFVTAPAEIGPVLSAYSTLRQSVEPATLGFRLGVSFFAALIGGSIGLFIDYAAGVKDPFWSSLWPLGLGGVGFLIGMAATHFKHTCSYVGRDGAAKFVCSGSREQLTTQEVFRFRDAVDLRTSQTLHYHNGSYQHTSYTYTWTDVGGRTRYVITGQHNSEAGTPPSTHAYHYARAAELAWTISLLGQIDRQIELSGSVNFNLRGGRWVRLGKGFVVLGLVHGGEPVEVSVEELARARVDKGVVSLRRIDAQEGWFSSSGVYKFSYEELANAQLFFHLLEKLVGVPVG